MELDKVLRLRRSVRQFNGKNLSWKHLTDILEAATLAPSSGNIQNWVFIVVREKKNVETLTELLPPEQRWAAKASVLVVVCSDTERVKQMYGARGEALYAVQNCAAAIQNMLLKAAELGVSSCWIGHFEEKDLAQTLALEKDIRPQALLAFGYGEVSEEKPREPLSSCVYFETFGNKTRNVGLWPLGNTLERGIKHIKAGLKK